VYPVNLYRTNNMCGLPWHSRPVKAAIKLANQNKNKNMQYDTSYKKAHTPLLASRSFHLSSQLYSWEEKNPSYREDSNGHARTPSKTPTITHPHPPPKEIVDGMAPGDFFPWQKEPTRDDSFASQFEEIERISRRLRDVAMAERRVPSSPVSG
jgi:hypothetical protein